MEAILLFLAFFYFGAAVGSFLNVVIDRGNSGESITFGRSHCDYCKKPLKVSDLLPVISFVSLRGKCRYCNRKLSYYYPLLEVVTGLSFVVALGAVMQFGSLGSVYPLASVLYYFLITSALIVIFFTDLKFGVIPVKTVILGVLITLGWHIFFSTGAAPLQNYLYSGIFSFLSLLCLFLITRGKGIGFGDVIYVFLMGLILGFPKIILGFYIAFISGAIISLVLIALKIKKFRGDTIPFGPFLVAGTFISLFWGEILIAVIMAYLLR